MSLNVISKLCGNCALVLDYDPVGSMQGLVIGQQGYGQEGSGYGPSNLSDAGVYPPASGSNLPDLGPGMSPRYNGSDISSTTGHQIHFAGMNPDSSQMGAWFDSDV